MVIQTLNFNDKAVQCYIINGKPWLKRKDVASILGYARPSKAIIDHVP